jgi:hypothetical protein
MPLLASDLVIYLGRYIYYLPTNRGLSRLVGKVDCSPKYALRKFTLGPR